MTNCESDGTVTLLAFPKEIRNEDLQEPFEELEHPPHEPDCSPEHTTDCDHNSAKIVNSFENSDTTLLSEPNIIAINQSGDVCSRVSQD